MKYLLPDPATDQELLTRIRLDNKKVRKHILVEKMQDPDWCAWIVEKHYKYERDLEQFEMALASGTLKD